MYKDKKVIGIDVSKDKIDVYKAGVSKVYSNDQQGFKLFKKELLCEYSHCVMEVTGAYHQLLAMYLHQKGVEVSVINPLIVKRFIQMQLHHNKTDKSDAKQIASFGEQQTLNLWTPPAKHVTQCKLIYACINQYNKQSTALKNKLHSLASQGIQTGALVRSVKRQVAHLKTEKNKLEEELEKLINKHDAELYTNLKSVPGLGKKTALLLIVSLDGFRDFENYRQVCAYLGLSPVEHSSGSSVRGRTRISKRGNPLMRNYLFMCSFTACEHNEQCKALYERIVNKGKSKKLALIAVSNKLIRQAFGIAKSGIPYDPMYKSKLSA